MAHAGDRRLKAVGIYGQPVIFRWVIAIVFVLANLDVVFAAPAAKPSVPAPVAYTSRGPANAPVLIEEFSDFQCPFCARSVATIEQVLKNYPKQVKVVFRHFPVAESHPNALLAHMASEAAGRQGRFWEMHDLLFANLRRVSRPDLVGYARQLGLDVTAFEAGLKDRALFNRVEADYEEGLTRQVRATPTFFINGRKVEGAIPYALFKKEIDAALIAPSR